MNFCFRVFTVNFKNALDQWNGTSLRFTQFNLIFLSLLDLAMNNTKLCKLWRCVLSFLPEDLSVKVLLTVLYSYLIPIIICANLLLIIGIIKTKRNKFTSSQILFSILFLIDLTFGEVGWVQLPVKTMATSISCLISIRKELQRKNHFQLQSFSRSLFHWHVVHLSHFVRAELTLKD